MWKKCERNVKEICKKCERNVKKICKKCERNVKEIWKKCEQNMKEICKKCGGNPDTSPDSPQLSMTPSLRFSTQSEKDLFQEISKCDIRFLLLI